jgi:hypothetical protein
VPTIELPDNVNASPPALRDWLRQHQVRAVLLTFSGGNDSGGVDEVRVLMTNGVEPVELGPKLRDSLADPLYAEFGSFAGEYSVEGNLLWDLSDEVDEDDIARLGWDMTTTSCEGAYDVAEDWKRLAGEAVR